MTEPVSLLPASATPWELAQSLTNAARRPLPTELVKTVWNAETCPAHLLDILANELSVDVWDAAWDEQKKRRWIRRAIPLHKIKGTLACIREYLAQTDGEIIRVTRPPEGFVLADAQTPEDYERWVRTLPQVRIFQDRVTSTAGPFLALEITALDLEALDELPDPVETGRKAVFWRDGVETPIGVDDSAGLDSLTVALRVPLRAFGALGFDEGCLSGPDDLAPIYRMGVSYDQTRALNPVSPGVRLQIVAAETVSEVLPAVGAYGDLGLLDADYFADELVSQIYYRIPIIEPGDARAANLGDVFGALDVSRFSIEPHRAELAIFVPGTFCDAAMALDWSPFGTAVWDNDTSRLDRSFAAISSAKRLSDEVVAYTNNYRPLVAGAPLYAGEEYAAGQWTRS